MGDDLDLASLRRAVRSIQGAPNTGPRRFHSDADGVIYNTVADGRAWRVGQADYDGEAWAALLDAAPRLLERLEPPTSPTPVYGERIMGWSWACGECGVAVYMDHAPHDDTSEPSICPCCKAENPDGSGWEHVDYADIRGWKVPRG